MGVGQQSNLPTLELASVRELRVVDLPLEGLPTRPIRGSRGMVEVWRLRARAVTQKREGAVGWWGGAWQDG